MEISTEELRTIILEELETVLDEKRKKRKKRKKKKVRRKGKRDACYHKVKARYDVWPSAYASGALTKCRKVGAANWGNKSKKNESLNESEDNFKPHMMYDPKSNKSEMTNKVEDHERLAKKGYTHVDPEKIRKIIGVGEGGAAGMDPFLKEFGKDMKDEIIKTLEAMPDIGKHKNGDYVMADKKEIDVVKEQKKNCGCGQDPCKTYGVQENLVNEIELEEKKKKKKPCKKAKGKRFVRRVNGRCRSFGQAGKAKGGGDRIRPGTKKADAYCARSAKIKKCKNPPCANDLSRKKWKCRGSKSERS
tara:strand:+ start:239 stop:1150 length:912 start_codon:yes stop_codon:yes gene_type:complete